MRNIKNLWCVKHVKEIEWSIQPYLQIIEENNYQQDMYVPLKVRVGVLPHSTLAPEIMEVYRNDVWQLQKYFGHFWPLEATILTLAKIWLK